MERVNGIEPSFRAFQAVAWLAENLAESDLQGNGYITRGRTGI